MADIDSDGQSIEVRCTVFRDEYPALFDYISSLPASRYRKRDALLRVMNAGIGVTVAGASGTLLAEASPIQRGPLSSAPVGMAQRIAVPLAETSSSLAPESIDAGDLFEVFGKKGG